MILLKKRRIKKKKNLRKTNIVFSGRFNKEYIIGRTLSLTSRGVSPPGALAI